MKKVYRPFWSYDLANTENWLSSMAKNGLFLVKMNRWTRCFFFQKGEPKHVTYRIAYDRLRVSGFPKALLESGWKSVAETGKWNIVANEASIENIKTTPVRDGIIKRNRIIMYIFIGVLLYLSGITLVNLSMFGLSQIQDGKVEIAESPLWWITYTFFGFVVTMIILAIFSIIKIKKGNNRLMTGIIPEQVEIYINDSGLNKEKEKELKRSGQIVVKRKPGWWYSPDKIENWLETMEVKGFNLYRVNHLGTVFYFLKGRPRRISYCADYQNMAEANYAQFHRDAGWKKVFGSRSPLQKWTIWSREYSEKDDRPHIYSDPHNRIKQARRVATAYTALFLPIVIIYILFLYADVFAFVFTESYHSFEDVPLLKMTMSLLLIMVFGSFIVRTWLYYLRLRKIDYK